MTPNRVFITVMSCAEAVHSLSPVCIDYDVLMQLCANGDRVVRCSDC